MWPIAVRRHGGKESQFPEFSIITGMMPLETGDWQHQQRRDCAARPEIQNLHKGYGLTRVVSFPILARLC
jgi:hypothetical protein